MKKITLLLMVSLFTTSGLFAQEKQRQRATPEERAKRQTEFLTKELNLTDEQKSKIYEISLKYAQPKADENKADLKREKRRESFQKNRDERAAAIKAVLTQEQQKKFEEHQKEMLEKTREGRKHKN